MSADEWWLFEDAKYRGESDDIRFQLHGFQLYDYRSTSVAKDGTITHVHERDGELREEWTEHISESPIRNVLGGWAWDLVLDPRSQGENGTDNSSVR